VGVRAEFQVSEPRSWSDHGFKTMDSTIYSRPLEVSSVE
jgi:hypothetical protein